jgi:asparagine synthase (glutamine-hydrolysing)
MLPAGHVQRIRAGRALSPTKPFQQIQDSFVEQEARPLAPGELRRLMLDSVRHHLVADVPVGIFLSAGIDSNLIAALAAELGTQLRTVTLAFDEYADTPDDEAPLAEATAKLLRSDHTTVRIGRDEFEELLDEFLGCMDQPTIDGLNTFLVSRATAKQGLKVALSGLGGDELFGGYPSFRQIPQLLKWGRRIPFSEQLGHGIQILLGSLPVPGLPPKARGVLSHSGDICSAYLLRRALYLEDELDTLLDESWLDEGLEKLSTAQAVADKLGPLRETDKSSNAQIAVLECGWYMRNQLLRDTDWASMAYGLEVRVPFVDVNLLERLGPAIASNTSPNKLDLAECAEQLPRSLRIRPKTGFTTPVRNWIGGKDGNSERGLRGWAANVHRNFRTVSEAGPSNVFSAAAE